MVFKDRSISHGLASVLLAAAACAGPAAANAGEIIVAMLSDGSVTVDRSASGQSMIPGDAIPLTTDQTIILLANKRNDGWVHLGGLESVELDDVPTQNDTFNGDGDDRFRVDIDEEAQLFFAPDALMQITESDGTTRMVGKAVHETDSSAAIGYDIYVEWPRNSGNFEGGLGQAGQAVSFWENDDGRTRGVLHIETNKDWTSDGLPPKPGLYEATLTVTAVGYDD